MLHTFVHLHLFYNQNKYLSQDDEGFLYPLNYYPKKIFEKQKKNQHLDDMILIAMDDMVAYLLDLSYKLKIKLTK